MNDRAPRFILIVEDDPLIAALYGSLFAGDRVELAESIREAMRWLREEPPDILILDYGLWFSTADELVGSFDVLPLTVVVSGNAMAPAFAQRIGAPLVRKPFDIDYLEDVIERAIAARREEQCRVE